MKQETLEEAAENVFNDFKSKNPIVPQKHILPFKHGYIQGAKWQQQRILKELQIRIQLLNSEPNGIVRDTMINNLLIDL